MAFALRKDDLFKFAANGLIALGVGLIVSRTPSGAGLSLPIGKIFAADYLLTSGLLIHIGLALAPWISACLPLAAPDQNPTSY